MVTVYRRVSRGWETCAREEVEGTEGLAMTAMHGLCLMQHVWRDGGMTNDRPCCLKLKFQDLREFRHRLRRQSNHEISGNQNKLMLFMVLCRRWVISTNFLVELLDGDSITIGNTPVNTGIVRWKCASSTSDTSIQSCGIFLRAVDQSHDSEMNTFEEIFRFIVLWKWILIAYSSFGSLA